MDDSWRDTYDAWKLRSPDDEHDDDYYNDDPDPDDCCHEDYDADILTGEASCHRCGHKWVQTAEEIARECRRQAEYYEHMRRLEWRERWLWWWDALWDALRHAAGRRRWRFKRRGQPAAINDDIPF